MRHQQLIFNRLTNISSCAPSWTILNVNYLIARQAMEMPLFIYASCMCVVYLTRWNHARQYARLSYSIYSLYLLEAT
jgi:hypothetical protein